MSREAAELPIAYPRGRDETGSVVEALTPITGLQKGVKRAEGCRAYDLRFAPCHTPHAGPVLDESPLPRTSALGHFGQTREGKEKPRARWGSPHWIRLTVICHRVIGHPLSLPARTSTQCARLCPPWFALAHSREAILNQLLI